MSVIDEEMSNLLRNLTMQELDGLKDRDGFEKGRLIGEILKKHEARRRDKESLAYLASLVGRKVWVNLPWEDSVSSFEGEIIRLETKEGRLVAVMSHPRHGEFDFDPKVYHPHLC